VVRRELSDRVFDHKEHKVCTENTASTI